jgi:heme/copper-type cytochrome/quinol oxidase subunit 4
MARNLVFAVTILLVGLLAFLTLSVALEDGVTVFVVISAVIVLILGVGALGALTSADDE